MIEVFHLVSFSLHWRQCISLIQVNYLRSFKWEILLFSVEEYCRQCINVWLRDSSGIISFLAFPYDYIVPLLSSRGIWRDLQVLARILGVYRGNFESLVNLDELVPGLLYCFYSKFLRDLEGASNEF